MRKIPGITSLVCGMAACSMAQTGLEITAFAGNGVIAWTNHATNVTCRVEWASDLNGPWRDSWTSLSAIASGTNAVMSAAVPMFYRVMDCTQEYMVIDLSEGSTAATYPVSYLPAVPAAGWQDEYKTTKMVLRRIPAGSFTMGSPTNELGHDSDELQHPVTLTKDFYMGVFEVSQKQWERVMGVWPSYFTNTTCRDSRPVEQTSYNDIRGAVAGTNWPADSSVDANSFMGLLRAKTGSVFDLPTEAQWEYACRAGTTNALNSGEDLITHTNCPNMNVVGRYRYNHPGGYANSPGVSTDGGTAKAGSYRPNAWGLYDMHGNLGEWCLDWYASASGDEVDPAGAASGLGRVYRGGAWHNGAVVCRSANRSNYIPGGPNSGIGFRVSLFPEP